MVDLSNESCSQKLLYFFRNGLVSLWSKNSLLLLDGLFSGINIKLVLYHSIVNSWHVLMSLGEDIQILLLELHDLILQV